MDRTARVWDLENGATAFRPLEGSKRSGVARLSPDGLLIADADGQGIHLWDAATGRLVRDLPAIDLGQVHSLAFSPTAHRLLAVGANPKQTLLMSPCGTSMPGKSWRDCRERPICPASRKQAEPGRLVRWRFRPTGNIWWLDSAEELATQRELRIFPIP